MESVRSRLFATVLPRGDGIRRATVQLAALTVALVLVMLLVLEGVVYVITQQTLLSSLETQLQQRSQVFDPEGLRALGYYGPGSGSNGFPGHGNQNGQPGNGGQQPPPNDEGNGPQGGVPQGGPSDTASVYVNRLLQVEHGDPEGALSGVLLNPTQARRTISTGRAQGYGVASYRDTDYLTFTIPIVLTNGYVLGAEQVSISERQYQQTLSTLRRSLLVVAVLGLLLAAGISAVLVRRALRPVHLAVKRQRDFVADAAHELRTPLAIMRTVGEVGLGSTSADDLQQTVAQMLAENQHLSHLVEDLSLLARTDTRAVVVARDRVDLSTLVRDTVGEIGYLAEDRDVSLRSAIAPGVQVQGDALRLRQLLLILLDNALKHTPDGGQVTVSLQPMGARVALRVEDSGPGIEPQALPRVFDRFYRADSARTGEGTGLGLAIGKWIVEAHGGHISAANASPHGAIFTVTLPALRQSAGAAVAAAKSADVSTATGSVGRPPSPP